MSSVSSEFWEKVGRAKDKLADQWLNHPGVGLIDIGYPPQQDVAVAEIVLRIHLRESWSPPKSEEQVIFPEEVDGIPVIVMTGDYRLETTSSSTAET